MNKRVKIDNYPQVDGISCTKRISGGSRYSRYEAYTDDGVAGELLWLNAPTERDLDWIQFCAQSHGRTEPTVIDHHLGPPAWILFKEQEGEPIETFLKDLDGPAKVDLYLSAAMQVCGILHTFHSAGHIHGKFSPQVIRLKQQPDDYLEVRLIGWQPPSEHRNGTAIDEFSALKSWLRTALERLNGETIVRSQVEDADEQCQLEDANELGKAPRSAVTALDVLNSARASTLADMLSALATLLTESLSEKISLIEDAHKGDKVFIEEVEGQRARLQELEAKQRYIRDWLFQNDERIERVASQVNRQEVRLRTLDSWRTRIQFSQVFVGQEQELPEVDAVSSSFNSFENERPEGMSVAPPVLPPEPTIVNGPEDQASEGLSRPSVRVGLGSMIMSILLLVVVGGLAGAWFLGVYESQPVKTTANIQATSGPTAHSSTESLKRPGRLNAQTGELSNDGKKSNKSATAIGIDPMAQTRDGQFGADGSVQAEQERVVEPTASPTDAPELDSGASPTHADSSVEALGDSGMRDASPKPVELPRGMIAIPPGQVQLGLSEEQVKHLYEHCINVRVTSASRQECKRIQSEQSDAKQPVLGFLLDVEEVSQNAYEVCVKSGRCRQKKPFFKAPGMPATGVSYASARQYCRSVNKRLPTYRELLYAARGENDRRIHPWGDQFYDHQGRYRANSGEYDAQRMKPNGRDRYKYAAPTNAFGQIESPWGARNLVGNVREWTSTKGEKGMLVFGGGWMSGRLQLRVTRRTEIKPTTARGDIGFRCALSKELDK